MATTATATNGSSNVLPVSSASNTSNGTNNFLFEYSPPNSANSSLKTTFKNRYLNNVNNSNNNSYNNNQGYTVNSSSQNISNNNNNNGSLNATTNGTSYLKEQNSIDSGVESAHGNNTTNLANMTLSPSASLSSNAPLNNNHHNHQPTSSYNGVKELLNGLNNHIAAAGNNGSYSPAVLSSAQYMANIENKCLRCGNQVYALERIGPIKGNIYHKTCFKCLICERQLDLKTYYTNQVDLNDRQIYCQSHAPKSGKGVFGADNIYIHSVLNAPKLDVMQKVDNKPKANIDGSARHIMHAVHAQHLIQMGNRKDTAAVMHHFPAFPQMNPANLKAREAIRKAQEILEAKQRAEEDMLLAKFRDERAKEEQKLEEEVKEEWEKRLQLIQAQYEADLKRKRDQKEQKDLTQKFRKEQEDLQKNMTIKREKKREDAKRMLLQLEQEATASLVTKHSEEMLKLIKAKEAEAAGTTDVADTKALNGSAKVGTTITPPPPQPPVRRKRDLYDDPSVFEYIDEQAINVAESEQTSYTELVDQLTFGLVTDLEKARAIFRWITVKDLNAIEFGESLTSDTPLGLLRGIKFGTETYHTLFMRLCSYAGMHCVDIKGHSKSVGYEPGMKIQPGKFTNTWNAVLIEGEWRFVQCNWGARHLVMSKDKKLEPAMTKPSRDKIKYQYDEHYFLPDPEEFILEFFPHNSDWQLLEQPITLDEFESLPFVRSLFFHYHLDFVNQRQAVIYTNSRGACDIKLRMPEDLKSRLAFHFHLRLSNKEDNEINGIKLERYVLHTIQDDLVSFNVHVPQVGEYFIEIFASLVEPDTNPFGQSFKLKCVCKYKITCEELTQRMHPLPACASGEWGPMKALRHFNIVPLTNKNAIIEAGQQQIELKFELPKQLKIHGKLHNNQLNELDKLIKHELTPATSATPFQLTVLVNLPEEGQFGLDIYARDPEYQSEKRTMSHCCKYLINYTKKEIQAAAAVNESSSPNVVAKSHQISVATVSSTAKSSNVPSPLANKHTSATTTTITTATNVTASPKVANVAATIVAPTSTQQQSQQSSPQSNLMQLIGPNTDLLNRLGMFPLSHGEPTIVLDELPQVDLQFKMSKAVDFSFDLKYDQTASPLSTAVYAQLKASENVKVKQYGYTICFSLNLPIQKYGNYLFTVYASDDQNKSKNLPAVYTYLIRYERKSTNTSAASTLNNNNNNSNSNNSPRSKLRYKQ